MRELQDSVGVFSHFQSSSCEIRFKSNLFQASRNQFSSHPFSRHVGPSLKIKRERIPVLQAGTVMSERMKIRNSCRTYLWFISRNSFQVPEKRSTEIEGSLQCLVHVRISQLTVNMLLANSLSHDDCTRNLYSWWRFIWNRYSLLNRINA